MTSVLLGVAVALLVVLVVAVLVLLRIMLRRSTEADPELKRLRDRADAELEQRQVAVAEREHHVALERDRLAVEAARQGTERSRQASDAARHQDELAAARRHLETELAAARERAEAEGLALLESTAALSRADAREQVVARVVRDAERQAALTVRDLEARAHEQGEQRARVIVADAVQRVASAQTSESVVTVLQLPSDDLKGRIIGREGRNIRAYEQVTGVNLVIDDTPEAVLLSCFDPVRREVGRLTLEKLVLDGRISPPRIEEVYEQARAEVLAGSTRAGEEALLAVGLSDMHPELVDLLGRLRLRTSYGQNVLGHLIETAHLAGMMASELGMDPTVTKRAAFLHDIGKALTPEVPGSHAAIGADLARRLGESVQVVHAIAAHHDEIRPETIEAVLTQASDSCSGSRPGARRESLESYVQRLQRIEEIAAVRPGVERVYAMQAGREVRVMVVPDLVDDVAALVLAREVARQIEDELTYPGQIRVTVVRESRATEVAR